MRCLVLLAIVHPPPLFVSSRTSLVEKYRHVLLFSSSSKESELMFKEELQIR